MWESRRLTTIWAFTACYRDDFTFYLIRVIMMMEKLVERWLAVETEALGENQPQCRFVHHKPHMPARTRTRAAAVGSQRLTACSMARPYKFPEVTTLLGSQSIQDGSQLNALSSETYTWVHSQSVISYVPFSTITEWSVIELRDTLFVPFRPQKCCLPQEINPNGAVLANLLPNHRSHRFITRLSVLRRYATFLFR
jgi:hypothetical protein